VWVYICALVNINNVSLTHPKKLNLTDIYMKHPATLLPSEGIIKQITTFPFNNIMVKWGRVLHVYREEAAGMGTGSGV
jgi:hypothetical protein